MSPDTIERGLAGLVLGTAVAIAPAAGAQSFPAETRDGATGLRVWEFPASNGAAFQMVVLVGVGASDEREHEAGISHFLEHGLLLGSADRTAEELTEQLRARSGANNGVTTHDYTGYWVSAPAAEWRFAVEWLAEQLTRPGFDPDEVARERDVVIEELVTKHGHAGPALIESRLYRSGPLGRSVGGTRESVERTDREAVVRWYEEHYRAGNVVVAFAGDVPSDACVAAVRAGFAGLPAGRPERPERELSPLVGDELVPSSRSSTDRLGFLIAGYHLEPGDADDLAALLLVEHVLDTAVFDEVRAERGLAYAPSVEAVLHRDTWRLDCSIKVGEAKNLPDVWDGVVLAIERTAAVDPTAFDRARRSVVSRLAPDGPTRLLRATALTWLVAGDGPAPDLEGAVLALRGDALESRVRGILDEERRFRISDSVDLIQPGYRIVLLTLLAVAAIGALVTWLRRRPGYGAWPRPRAKGAKPRKGKLLRGPSRGDVDRLERDIQKMFEDEDAGRNDRV